MDEKSPMGSLWFLPPGPLPFIGKRHTTTSLSHLQLLPMPPFAWGEKWREQEERPPPRQFGEVEHLPIHWDIS